MFQPSVETYEKRLRRLLLAVLLVVVVFLFGTFGYMIIEGWNFLEALFMTLITISTVGYGIIKELNPAGTVFTMVLIVAGISVVLNTLSNLAAFIVEGEVLEIYRRRKMMKEIGKLEKHHVVVGLGKVGRYVVAELLRAGEDVVAVDESEEVIQSFIEEEELSHLLWICGDATDETTLARANVANACAAVVALPEDSKNVFALLTIKFLNPSIIAIATVNNPRNATKLFRAGADRVISPSEIVGGRIAAMLTRPGLVSFLDVINRPGKRQLRMEIVTVPSGSPLVGRTLAEAAIPQKTGLIVIAIQKGNEEYFNPTKGTIIEGGNALFVLGEPHQIEALKNLVEGRL